jgi:hypothetical protein
MKRLKQPTQRIPLLRSVDQTWVRSDKEKANTFAGHLEKTFKPNKLPKKRSPRNRNQQRAEGTATNNTSNHISYTKGNSKHKTRKSQPKESPLDMTYLQGEY